MKLGIKAFALACGIVSGLGLLLLTWWIMAFDGPSAAPTWLTHVYRGYNLTSMGSLIGAAWAFCDGLVCGAVFACLYDFIESHVTVGHRVSA
jgi:hypothetical protein